jgi:hypothetical protein
VAQLERILGGTNVLVTSPDYLVDLRTGLTRQVDVTLRTQIDSKPVLIILECRKWASAQDVTWIDELATRCRALGATRIIAVSSKGFSKGAQAAARHEGIELRTVAELTGQTVFGWLGIEALATYPSNLDVTGIRLHIEGDDPNKLPPEYWDAPNAVEAMNARFLIQPNGQRRSIADVWNNVDKHELFESLPPSTRRPVQWRADFPDPSDRLHVRGPGGSADVMAIEVDGTFRYELHQVPLKRFYEYVGEGGDLLQVAEAEVATHDGMTVLNLARSPTGRLDVAARRVEGDADRPLTLRVQFNIRRGEASDEG